MENLIAVVDALVDWLKDIFNVGKSNFANEISAVLTSIKKLLTKL